MANRGDVMFKVEKKKYINEEKLVEILFETNSVTSQEKANDVNELLEMFLLDAHLFKDSCKMIKAVKKMLSYYNENRLYLFITTDDFKEEIKYADGKLKYYRARKVDIDARVYEIQFNKNRIVYEVTNENDKSTIQMMSKRDQNTLGEYMERIQILSEIN